MKKKFIIALWCCLIATSVNAGEVGAKVIKWSGIDLITGETVRFPEILDNKPALFVFWSTWCPYCTAFMPEVKKIQADYGDKIKIITFNANERGIGDPKAYAQKLDFPFIAIADANKISRKYKAKLPGLLIVNGEGELIYQRKRTKIPPGDTLNQFWSKQLRNVLDNHLLIQKYDL